MVDQIQTQVKLKPLTPKPNEVKVTEAAAKPAEVKPEPATTETPYRWTEPASQKKVTESHIELIKVLLDLPFRIAEAQKEFDAINRKWLLRKVELTIQAYTTPIFPGKKAEDGMRCASNEAERETAIDKVTLTDDLFATLSDEREAALRTLMLHKNHFEADKLTAQLEAATGSKS